MEKVCYPSFDPPTQDAANRWAMRATWHEATQSWINVSAVRQGDVTTRCCPSILVPEGQALAEAVRLHERSCASCGNADTHHETEPEGQR
jgi:hypothetical protein